MEYLVYIIVAIIFIMAFLFGYIFGPQISNNIINRKMEELGATLIRSEYRNGLIRTGPFKYVSRHSNVYVVLYELDGIDHEGWVKITVFIWVKWRLDE